MDAVLKKLNMFALPDPVLSDCCKSGVLVMSHNIWIPIYSMQSLVIDVNHSDAGDTWKVAIVDKLKANKFGSI